MRKSDNSIIRVFLRNMLIMTYVAIAILGIALIEENITRFLQDSSKIHSEYIAFQKATIKKVVEKAVEEFNHWQSFSKNGSLKVGKDEITKAIFERLSKITYGKNSEGFIFVGNFDGIELVNREYPHLIGKNFWDMEDTFGVKIFQEEIKIAKTKPEGDFLKYWWSGKSDPKGAIPKMSFVKGVKDYELFIGAGMNMNEVDEVIEQKRSELKQHLKYNIIRIILTLIVLSLVVLWLSSRISKRIKKNIDTFSSFFNQAATDALPINPDQVYYSEFVQLASSANRMVEERMKTERALQSSYERFTIVMDSLDALVYVADLETHELLFLNKYGQDIWGDSIGEKCWKTLQSGQIGPCDFCTTDKLLNANGEPTGVYVWEFQNLVDDQWYECRDQIIRWMDGRFVRLEIATNITERKQAEKALRESENRFRDITHSMADWIWEVDKAHPTF